MAKGGKRKGARKSAKAKSAKKSAKKTSKAKGAKKSAKKSVKRTSAKPKRAKASSAKAKRAPDLGRFTKYALMLHRDSAERARFDADQHAHMAAYELRYRFRFTENQKQAVISRDTATINLEMDIECTSLGPPHPHATHI
jgi:hypothetical protein